MFKVVEITEDDDWRLGIGSELGINQLGDVVGLLGIGLAPFLGPAVPTLMQAAAWLSLLPATVALASLVLGLRATKREGASNNV